MKGQAGQYYDIGPLNVSHLWLIMTHIMIYHDPYYGVLWPILWHRSVKCFVPSLTYWPHLTWWDKLTSCIFDKSDGHNSTGYLGPSCILRLYQSPVPCYTIVYNAPETWSVVSRWPSSRLGHWSCYTNALIMSYKYIDHVIQVHWSCYTNTLILLYKYTNLCSYTNTLIMLYTMPPKHDRYSQGSHPAGAWAMCIHWSCEADQCYAGGGPKEYCLQQTDKIWWSVCFHEVWIGFKLDFLIR